jgi:hypothetical protein
MYKHLSCALPRLSSSEPVAVVRVSGCLPGLYLIPCGFDPAPAAVGGTPGAGAPEGAGVLDRYHSTKRGCHGAGKRSRRGPAWGQGRAPTSGAQERGSGSTRSSPRRDRTASRLVVRRCQRHVCFSPDNDRMADIANSLFGANRNISRRLFDYLISSREKLR